MGALKLLRDEDLREEFTSGPGSLLSEWQKSIVRELVDPGSTMDKQELAVAHKVINRFLEVISEISSIDNQQ